ncbi:MAG TPA: methyl-accepting chemotaxis protein [Devosia sp.]|jgi:methyl-accepting chemotaxis protein|nr:methyl-accepting chemotaxis protein [Devosia sp.]
MKSLFSRPFRANAAANDRATLAAFEASQAIIQFDLDGTILTANENFLALMGYSLEEVVGKHHAIFVDPEEVKDPEYKAFWARLGSGEFDRGEYKRFAKDGQPVWIQASYNPVFDDKGNPIKVVKLASDVTVQRMAAAESEGQLNAIGRSQAVIEFDLLGNIVSANANFCAAMGYDLEELVGRHHSLFVTQDYARSAEYKAFWQRLGQGEFEAGEFRRLGKAGREVWIQASYNPIFDLEGKPYKVVKYATDVTARKRAVNLLGQGLAKLADGELNTRITEPFEGELEEVRHAFNETTGRFADIIRQLRETSATLKNATGEILTGANDLAERTTRQAATIEETSAAIEQLSSTVSDNAKRAGEAAITANVVSKVASESGAVMTDANSAMERISQSSNKISSIIGLIDDVAFQTNLLALNASVEAARAGDAGKGFAVVAVEVRRLAQSAASASAEVKALVQQSADEVRNGSKLVSDAAKRLGSMLEAVNQNSALVEGIASASQEQASSIAEMVTAIRLLDEMTQHNAALVEETNAAIEQAEGQASELDGIAEIFRIQEEKPGNVVKLRVA